MEVAVGLFSSKATRAAQYRELLALAKSTLEQLGVDTFADEEEGTQAVWTDRTKELIPLEYRSWMGVHVSALVTHVHDVSPAEFGSRGLLVELAESVQAVRACLAGLTDDTRGKFRAVAFARMQGRLDELIADVSRALATEGTLIALSDPLEGLVESARTALPWFTKQDDLDAAFSAAKPEEKLPKPGLHELARLLREGEAVLAKAREREAGRRLNRA